MATRQARMRFTIKRARGFLRTFVKSKRGVIGVLILVVSIFVALAAPLLAQYDPVFSTNLAGVTATPIWYDTIFPSQPQSQNMAVVKDPGFNSSADMSQFNTTSSGSNVNIHYDASVGDTAPGCMAIAYSGPANPKAGTSFANVTNTFFYPYRHWLEKFVLSVGFYVDGSSHIDANGQLVLDVPVHIGVFLIDDNKTTTTAANTTSPVRRYDLTAIYANASSQPGSVIPDVISSPTTSWIPTTNYDSHNMRKTINGTSYDPSIKIFNVSNPHDFTLAFEVTFMSGSSAYANPHAETTVYMDDVHLKGYGTSFGLFGTDQQGRDIYSQLVYGSRISLLVGLLSSAIAIGLGLLIGIIAGYQGGIVDEVLMRFTDALLVIPNLPLLLVLVSVLGQNIWNIIMVLGVLGWMGFARLVRSMILSLRERPFVESAKAVGAGSGHIMGVHILPNVMALVYVNLAISVPSAIVSEAALSFLGFSDPRVMSWGKILYNVSLSQTYIGYWWWVIPPGLLISIVAMSFIFIGYALDAILNPRLRERQ